MTDKQIINGIKYEKLTQDQLHDLSQWELVDIILAYRKDLKAKKKEYKRLEEELYYWVNGEYCDNKCNVVKELDQLKAELDRANCQIADDEILQCDMREAIEELRVENNELNTINTRLLERLEVDKTDTSLVFNLDKELRQAKKEFYIAIQKVVKLEQTLTEIKEIIQSDYCTEIGSCEFCAEIGNCLNRKILQKISEVENEYS